MPQTDSTQAQIHVHSTGAEESSSRSFTDTLCQKQELDTTATARQVPNAPSSCVLHRASAEKQPGLLELKEGIKRVIAKGFKRKLKPKQFSHTPPQSWTCFSALLKASTGACLTTDSPFGSLFLTQQGRAWIRLSCNQASRDNRGSRRKA